MRSGSFLPLVFVLVAGSARADRDTALRAYQQRDFATALKEWKALADSGDADAEFRVAANWYRKAAEQAYARAQYALGMLYDLD